MAVSDRSINFCLLGSTPVLLEKLWVIVREVNDRQTQIVIESAGQPVVAVVPYGYLMNLLEALEDAIDSRVLKNAVASNDGFFSFEEAIEAHNQAHNVEVQVVQHALVKINN